MTKLPKEIPNPFEFRDQLKKLEKANAKQKSIQDRIIAIRESSEPPKDKLSWEYYIWRTRDPLRIK
jgi:hypothetical protein